jgi:glycosyltransferase involved in cell wall biosynthesis
MSPLVSVLMPCHNSSQTLPMALASLVAQTYTNWECVLVDDGSADNPEEILAAAKDRRLRCIRLAQNRGRGFARQAALENARGELIAMLDADDWYYPEKLERQVRILKSDPDLAVISTGLAITGPNNELRGVRVCRRPESGSVLRARWTELRTPPVAFAPSMMRAETAKQFQFNPSFPLGEDADYLLRFLLGRYYGALPELLYAYSEHASVSAEKVTAAFRMQRETFMSFRRQFPIASRVNAFKGHVKAAGYRAFFRLGLWEWAIARRSHEPTAAEHCGFLEAREVVERAAEVVFDGALPAKAPSGP